MLGLYLGQLPISFRKMERTTVLRLNNKNKKKFLPGSVFFKECGWVREQISLRGKTKLPGNDEMGIS